MTSTKTTGTVGLVASLLAATLYQGSHDRDHKFWDIVSTERYIFIPYAGAARMFQHINGKFTTLILWR